MRLQWSGANNPLWYIQNNKIIEITANKQPIGKYDRRTPFTTHDITYQPNTTFYLFTDGYADQFGGAKELGRVLFFSVQATARIKNTTIGYIGFMG